MFDGISPSETPTADAAALQRMRGVARIRFAHRYGCTRLADLYQEGAAKIRLPRVARDALPEAVTINTAGGITAGDRFSIAVQVDDGAAAVATTQACEKIYRAVPGLPDAALDVSLRIGSGASLDWLPQETILFDRARLRRRLDIDLAENAAFLGCEAVLLGRTAMGETVSSIAFRDRWSVRRGGRLIFADATRLNGERADYRYAGSATLAGGRAFATLLRIGPDPAEMRDALRNAIAPLLRPGLDAGASVVQDDVLAARFCAADGRSLRQALFAAFDVLRPGRALPLVWTI